MKQLPYWLVNPNPDIYLEDGWLVVDVETTNKDKGSALNPQNELILWVAFSATGYVSGQGDDVQILREKVRRAKFIVAHHGKFDLQWLYRLGIEPGTILLYDSLLGEYVLAGNRRWDLTLDATARRYGVEGKQSLVSTWINGGVCPSEIPYARLEEYCKQDVAATYNIFVQQRVILKEQGLLPCFFTRNLTCLCLADIEANGMWLDKGRVEAKYRETLAESRDLLGRLHEFTGGINPKSPQQVAEYLYDVLGFEELKDYNHEPIRTEKGGRRTNEETILALKATTARQKEFTELFTSYTPIKKKLETLTKLNNCVQEEEPLHFNFNQAVTGTHRLSSNGKKFKVQGQNIDRTFKELFRARYSGWVVGDVDAAQIEWRGGGFLGNDPQIKQDVKDHFDVHRNTASVLLKKDWNTVSKDERTLAKPRTFAPMFGSTSGTPDERRYNKAFRERYKALNETQKNWTYQVLADKKLVTATGLIFYWPGCEIYDSGYIKYTTEIFNYPVQSFCGAEIIPISLVYLWFKMKALHLRSFLTNTIHDAVVGEIEPSEVSVWEELVKEAFTKDVVSYLDKVYGIKFDIPLAIAYSFDTHWAQGKDIEYEWVPE